MAVGLFNRGPVSSKDDKNPLREPEQKPFKEG